MSNTLFLTTKMDGITQPPLAIWRLVIGIHDGTLMSRDLGDTTHISLEDCRRDVEGAEKDYAKLGCFIWFATAHGPDGEIVELHKGTPYHS